MSLPQASASRNQAGTSIDPKEQDVLDAPLIALTQKSNGDLRQLLYHFFSFLHRRTDFYMVPHADDVAAGRASMGFPVGDAEKVLLAAFRQFPLRQLPLKEQQMRHTTPPTTSSTASASRNVDRPDVSREDVRSNPIAAPSVEGQNVERRGDVSFNGDTTEVDNLMSDVRLTEEGLQIPVGNGGSAPRYKWTQTLDECSVLVGMPTQLRGRDLEVEIKPTSIRVQSKVPLNVGSNDRHIFVSGELAARIVASESTWSLEGGVLVLILYKQQKSFWKTVLQGDPEIDTTLVDSRRHLRDYDEVTQAQLRKIVFDQSQTSQGLPTSDELSGQKPNIPPLPPGVEYIDREKLDIHDKGATFAP